jgi:hypothetical protein
MARVADYMVRVCERNSWSLRYEDCRWLARIVKRLEKISDSDFDKLSSLYEKAL